MKRKILTAVVICFVSSATAALAYDPATHSQLSDAAARVSVLTPQSVTSTTTTILEDLDLLPYDAPTTGTPSQAFRDIQNTQWILDGSGKFIARDPLSIRDLIKTGAELEDEGNRPLNHFYDPHHNVPLTFGSQVGYTAPDWALHERCSTYSSSAAYDPSGDNGSWSNQCFSLQDALAYYQSALINPDPNVRNTQFGNLFLTLGHVMHLLQDMAQPQHVRNDIHCDEFIECGPLYNPSRYEKIVYSSTQGADLTTLATYPVVALPTAQTYWSTVNTAYAGAGEGLADFTNSNFVSAGSNFVSVAGSGLPIAAPNFPDPRPNGTYTESVDTVYGHFGHTAPSDVDAYCATLQAPLTCDVTLVESPIVDAIDDAPSCDDSDTQFFLDTACENANSASYSIFADDLIHINANQANAYTLNDDNIQSAMNYLLPRAIGYSAGLINYFFRGKLDVNLNPQDPVDSTNGINFVINNLSSVALGGGTLAVYYDGTDGQRHNANATVPSTFGLGAADCQPTGCSTGLVSIPLPLPSPAAKPYEFMFVYNGTIGNETGIAAKYFGPADLSLLADAYQASATSAGYDTVVTVDEQGDLKSASGLEPTPGCVAGVPASWPESCWPQYYMVVYDGIEYVASQDWGVDEHPGGNIIKYQLGWNGTELEPAVSYQQCTPPMAIAGIAINNTYLYVLVARRNYGNSGVQGSCPYGSGGTYLDKFDHSGNFIAATFLSDLPIVPGTPDTDEQATSVGDISANNTHICIPARTEKWDTGDNLISDKNFAELEDPEGGGGIMFAQGDYPAACASTSDRHYLILGYPTGGSQSLGSYDDNGASIASIPLPSNKIYSHIAAVSNTIYLSSSGYDSKGLPATVVSEFKRQITNGVETIIPVTTFAVEGTESTFFATTPAISTDIFKAINLPSQ